MHRVGCDTYGHGCCPFDIQSLALVLAIGSTVRPCCRVRGCLAGDAWEHSEREK